MRYGLKETPMSKILHARSESLFGSLFGREVLDYTKKYEGRNPDWPTRHIRTWPCLWLKHLDHRSLILSCARKSHGRSPDSFCLKLCRWWV